jgi:hypothetical protein
MRTRLISTHFYQCKGLWRHWWNHQFCAWCLMLRHERQRWSVLLREQDQAGHKSNHFRGKHGFSQGLCRLPTRYVLYVRSSCYISSRFVGEKRESSDSCCLLGFLSNSKILCNVCQSVSLNFRQAAGAAKCPARLRVKAEKAVWRHLDRWRLPWNFDRYVLMLEANLPQEALYSLSGFMFMDDLAIVRRVALVERLFRNLPENSHFRCSLSVNHDPSTSWHNCCTQSKCALHPKAIHTSRQQLFGDGFGHRLPNPFLDFVRLRKHRQNPGIYPKHCWASAKKIELWVLICQPSFLFVNEQGVSGTVRNPDCVSGTEVRPTKIKTQLKTQRKKRPRLQLFTFSGLFQ